MMLATPGATRMLPATGACHVSEVCDAFKLLFITSHVLPLSGIFTVGNGLHPVTDIVALSHTMAANGRFK
jgi:hypothetical protein